VKSPLCPSALEWRKQQFVALGVYRTAVGVIMMHSHHISAVLDFLPENGTANEVNYFYFRLNTKTKVY